MGGNSITVNSLRRELVYLGSRFSGSQLMKTATDNNINNDCKAFRSLSIEAGWVQFVVCESMLMLLNSLFLLLSLHWPGCPRATVGDYLLYCSGGHLQSFRIEHLWSCNSVYMYSEESYLHCHHWWVIRTLSPVKSGACIVTSESDAWIVTSESDAWIVTRDEWRMYCHEWCMNCHQWGVKILSFCSYVLIQIFEFWVRFDFCC